jgi:hypothetical protein
MLFAPYHGALGPKFVADSRKTRLVCRRVLVEIDDYPIFCGHVIPFYSLEALF